MAWIEIIPEEKAQGDLKRLYDTAIQRAGRVWNIVRVMSQNAGTLQASMGFYLSCVHGESPLSRAQREMLAVVVSKANDCHY